MEVEMLQHQASETLRNGARQLVVGEIQGSEAGEVTQLGRYGARQLVAGEIQCHEAGKVTQLGRNGPCQLVVREIQVPEAGRSPNSAGMVPVSWLE